MRLQIPRWALRGNKTASQLRPNPTTAREHLAILRELRAPSTAIHVAEEVIKVSDSGSGALSEPVERPLASNSR
jgi:hypothetical protein